MWKLAALCTRVVAGWRLGLLLRALGWWKRGPGRERRMSGSPLAGLCLGHTARRFGRLSDESVALARSLAARAEVDPSDVDGRALDGFDDVRSFPRLW
ncbi:hypothetical protein [Nocardia sp. NPDC004750]